MTKTKPYMTEASLPFNTTERMSVSYSTSRRAPTNLSTQFLGPKNDMERLVDKGLKDIPWLKRFLQSTGMASILDYAELRITNSKQLNDQERQECIDVINKHSLRQKKSAAV